MSDLLIKLSDIPGFYPVGLKVYINDWHRPNLVVSTGTTSNNREGLFSISGWGWHQPCNLYLDLSDSSTRDRLARFVCKWIHSPTTAPGIVYDYGDKVWLVGGVAFEFPDLDPANGELFPDGSPCVFAIALGRAARASNRYTSTSPHPSGLTSPRGHQIAEVFDRAIRQALTKDSNYENKNPHQST